MIRKLVIPGSIALAVLLAVFIFYYLFSGFIFDQTPKTTTFKIQIGTVLNDEVPGMRDAKSKFKNDKPLKVIVVYHPTSYDAARFNGDARVYITKKGEYKVLQDHLTDEFPNMAEISFELHNLWWDKGKYVVHFERDGQEVQTKEFELK